MGMTVWMGTHSCVGDSVSPLRHWVLAALGFREVAGAGSEQRRLWQSWHLGRALKVREVFGRRGVKSVGERQGQQDQNGVQGGQVSLGEHVAQGDQVSELRLEL